LRYVLFLQSLQINSDSLSAVRAAFSPTRRTLLLAAASSRPPSHRTPLNCAMRSCSALTSSSFEPATRLRSRTAALSPLLLPLSFSPLFPFSRTARLSARAPAHPATHSLSTVDKTRRTLCWWPKAGVKILSFAFETRRTKGFFKTNSGGGRQRGTGGWTVSSGGND
jgi:hypothetical protein